MKTLIGNEGVLVIYRPYAAVAAPSRVACVALILVAAHGLLLAQHPDPEFPRIAEPTGSFRVGHTLIDWVDESRREPGSEDEDDHRQLPVEIWYPAADDAAGEPALYRPRAKSFESAWGREAVEFFASVRTSWSENAELSDAGPFGMFVFSHGWGARSSSHSTFLANLASYGYIAVGINHPYLGMVALKDGSVTETNDSQFSSQAEANAFYAADVRFVIDRMLVLNDRDPEGPFERSIDPQRIAAGGHSSGFPAASGAAVVDKRIRALISFDAGAPRVVREKGLDVPILLFRADSSSSTDLFFRGPKVHPKGTIYDVSFFRMHRADFYDLVISGTTHNSIYDEYLFAESEEEKTLSVRNHRIIARVASEYLNMVTRNEESKILSGDEELAHTVLRVILKD